MRLAGQPPIKREHGAPKKMDYIKMDDRNSQAGGLLYWMLIISPASQPWQEMCKAEVHTTTGCPPYLTVKYIHVKKRAGKNDPSKRITIGDRKGLWGRGSHRGDLGTSLGPSRGKFISTVRSNPHPNCCGPPLPPPSPPLLRHPPNWVFDSQYCSVPISNKYFLVTVLTRPWLTSACLSAHCCNRICEYAHRFKPGPRSY